MSHPYATVTIYGRDAAGVWQWWPMTPESWNRLLRDDGRLARAIYDPCTAFTEESIANDWATMPKRERQARYAEHKAARAMRTEARAVKSIRVSA